ncbi:type IV fimbrial biogenesis protein FimT [Oxalobacteraceae bacterium GrIS 2.11]
MSSSVPRPGYMPLISSFRAAGFTMVELLVALVIVLVLARIAIPQFNTAIQIQQTGSEINNLKNDIDFARSEAIKEGQTVSLCISSNGTSCAGTAWNNGWIIFSNPSGGTGFGAGSVVLRAQSAFASSDTIVTNPIKSTLSFNQDGFSVGLASGTGLIFKIHNASSNNQAVRCIWLNLIGPPLIQIYGQAASSTAQGTNTCS